MVIIRALAAIKDTVIFEDGQGILKDVLGLFGNSLPEDGLPSSSDNTKRKNFSGSGGYGGSSTTLDFCMETLSTLLDRVDDAFTISSFTKNKRSTQ